MQFDFMDEEMAVQRVEDKPHFQTNIVASYNNVTELSLELGKFSWKLSSASSECFKENIYTDSWTFVPFIDEDIHVIFMIFFAGREMADY